MRTKEHNNLLWHNNAPEFGVVTFLEFHLGDRNKMLHDTTLVVF